MIHEAIKINTCKVEVRNDMIHVINDSKGEGGWLLEGIVRGPGEWWTFGELSILSQINKERKLLKIKN